MFVKYVPLGRQRAVWGRFLPPKHNKISFFREAKKWKCKPLLWFLAKNITFSLFSHSKGMYFKSFSRLCSAFAKMMHLTNISSLSSAFANSVFLAKSHLSRKSRILRDVNFDTFWGPYFLAFCRTVAKSEQKPPTKMGSKMKPVWTSTALWAPAARGTSRGLAPPAPYVFYNVFEALLEAANGASPPVVRL